MYSPFSSFSPNQMPVRRTKSKKATFSLFLQIHICWLRLWWKTSGCLNWNKSSCSIENNIEQFFFWRFQSAGNSKRRVFVKNLSTFLGKKQIRVFGGVFLMKRYNFLNWKSFSCDEYSNFGMPKVIERSKFSTSFYWNIKIILQCFRHSNTFVLNSEH